MRTPIISAGFNKFSKESATKLGITFKHDKYECYLQLVVFLGRYDFVVEIS